MSVINIINADIVLPDRILKNSCIAVEDGIIHKIDSCTCSGEIIDAQGAYLMPGMIDIHSDNIEQVVEPRPGSLMDIAFAFRQQEKQLICNGITTMYHSLSMWPKLKNANPRGGTVRKAAREDECMRKIIEEISNAEKSRMLINHKLHLRFDVTYIEAVDALLDLLNSGSVSLLSFMDHTPGQGQYRDIEKLKEFVRGNNPTVSEDVIDAQMAARMDVQRVPPQTIAKIAETAHNRGIAVASHDDDSIEKVDTVVDEWDADISEFPVEIDVARHAKKRGMETLGGAANVLLGKSHSGNMSAIEGILDGSITMLCSDYYPPAMLQSVFILHKKHGIPLHDCVNFVTLAPARSVAIDDCLGSIAQGKTADLIMVDASGEYPIVKTVMTNGKSTAEFATNLH